MYDTKVKYKKVYGIGVNDVTYKVQRYEKICGKWNLIWVCPYYLKWKGILQRCYSEKEHIKNPKYIGCEICAEWVHLSNFIKWVDSQPNRDWENCEPDKDILQLGNKLYSPDTCRFVSHNINCFISDRTSTRGNFYLGVDFVKREGKFRARCSNPFGKTKAERSGYLGHYATELEAHKAWQAKKHEYACMLAKTQTDAEIIEALINRYKPSTDWTKS